MITALPLIFLRSVRFTQSAVLWTVLTIKGFRANQMKYKTNCNKKLKDNFQAKHVYREI